MLRTSIASAVMALLVPATAFAGRGGGFSGGGSHSSGGGGGGFHSSGGGGGGFHSSGFSAPSSSHSSGYGGAHGGGQPHNPPTVHGTSSGGGGGGHGGGGHGGGTGPVIVRGGGWHGGYVGGGTYYSGGTVYYDPGTEYVDTCDETGDCGQASSSIRIPMLFEVGGAEATFQGPQMTGNGQVGFLGDLYGYSLSSGTPSARDTNASLAAMRASIGIGPHVYVGGELAAGTLGQSPIQVTPDNAAHVVAATPTLERTTMLAYDVFAGLRARSSAVELDGELAFGQRHFTSVVDPVSMGVDFGDGENVDANLPLVEARVRGVLWVTPHVSLALQIGTGLEDRSELTGGLLLGFAATPYAEPVP